VNIICSIKVNSHKW